MRSTEATVNENATPALGPITTNGAPPYVTPTTFNPSSECSPARYQSPGLIDGEMRIRRVQRTPRR